MVKFTFEEAPVGGGEEQPPVAVDDQLPGTFLNYCTTNHVKTTNLVINGTWG
jgi:hypothetical protein